MEWLSARQLVNSLQANRKQRINCDTDECYFCNMTNISENTINVNYVTI